MSQRPYGHASACYNIFWWLSLMVFV